MLAAFHRDKDTVIAWVFIVFFAVLSFSYTPTLSLGVQAGMNIDISLIYLVLAITAFICLILTPISMYRDILKSYRAVPHTILVGVSAYGVFALLSTLWSANPTKGVVTALYLCLIIFVVLNMYIHRMTLLRYRRCILRAVAATLSLAVLFGYWQVFADAIGLAPVWSQLPTVYQSTVFGFARPTGFSLEPQFFGSLLVPIVLYLTYRIVFRPSNVTPYRWYVTFVLFFTMTLMTLSRGAIFSLAIGSILLLCLGIYTHRQKDHQIVRAVARYGGLIIVSVILSCGAIVSAAHINTRDDIGGAQAVVKYIDQLSLGAVHIDLPQPSAPTTPVAQTPSGSIQSPSLPPAPTGGYVEESTNSRLLMSRTALELWRSTPVTTLIGVGFGGYGAAAHTRHADLVPYSIVNNYYLEVLVETGIIGLTLLLVSLGYLGYRLLRRQSVLLFCILIAAMVQMLFYSGNANTIHVWVLIGLCIIELSRLTAKRPRSKKGTKMSTLPV